MSLIYAQTSLIFLLASAQAHMLAVYMVSAA